METLQLCENDALVVDDLLDFPREGDSSYLLNSAATFSLEGSRASDESGDFVATELEWWSGFVEESQKGAGAENWLPLVRSEQWFISAGGRKEGSSGKRPTSIWLRMGTSSQILDAGSSPLIERPAAPNSSWPSRSEWDKRSRSKRSSRSGGRVWSLQSVSLSHKTRYDDEEEVEEEEEETSSLDYERYQQPCKKAKRDDVVQEGRRCSHCQVQQTPQWRAGPLGPKTLCNACGVRFKSGRLLPEYRPAASPTFISELHSNSHKKVLEMRTFKSCVAQARDQDEFSSCSQESISSVHL